MENMLGTALQDVCGPLRDLMQRLGGKHGAEWLTALKLFLRKENPWPTPSPTIVSDFKVWKEVTFAESVVRLVVVTPVDLGYPFGASRKALYERAQEQGLELAHWGIAYALCRAYTEQPVGESLVVASLPQDKKPEGKYYDYQWRWLLRSVSNQGQGPRLFGEKGSQSVRWNRHTKFVFVLPNRTS